MSSVHRSGQAPVLSWLGFLSVITMLLLGIALVGCPAREGREIERHTSLDKVVDAVVVEPKSHATAPIMTDIYLVASGKNWKDEIPVITGDYIEGLRVQWERPRFLTIHYKKGRIRHFTNIWYTKDVQNFEYVIELRLVPETDSTLPN